LEGFSAKHRSVSAALQSPTRRVTPKLYLNAFCLIQSTFKTFTLLIIILNNTSILKKNIPVPPVSYFINF